MGARADYTKAIELAPEDPYAYEGRGTVVLALGTPPPPFPDFTRAIELDPEFAFAYEGAPAPGGTPTTSRGARGPRQGPSGLQEPFGAWLCNRGVMRFDAGGTPKPSWTCGRPSASRTTTCTAPTPRYYLWMARALLGEREAASKELREWLDGQPAIVRRSWGGDLARFVTVRERRLSSRRAPRRSGGRARRSSGPTQFAVGLLRLVRDDQVGARAAFEKTVALGGKSVHERRSAIAILRRMRGREVRAGARVNRAGPASRSTTTGAEPRR